MFSVEGADQVSDDEIPYDPAMAGTLSIGDSPSISGKRTKPHSTRKSHDEDEIYDPESAFPTMDSGVLIITSKIAHDDALCMITDDSSLQCRTPIPSLHEPRQRLHLSSNECLHQYNMRQG